MVSLNDYLYSGDTVIRILHNYYKDLKASSLQTGNTIDMLHCNFLLQQIDMLEHNDFLTDQSQRLREFYKYMVRQYPFLAFTFKGRIKSLIRSEQKFNGYICSYIYKYYNEKKEFPSVMELREHLNCFRDLIAYRIVVSLPMVNLQPGQNRQETERNYLYEIANSLPGFLEQYGFTMQVSEVKGFLNSSRLNPELRPYYRDYIQNPNSMGYQSLHITLYDIIARCFIEVQLRTKEMDDYAEIGPANHLGYEKRQERERMRRDVVPYGNIYFDEAYERETLLHQLDLSKVNVNMFGAVDNSLINDGCGLFRGRLITPFEHLSRFQKDFID